MVTFLFTDVEGSQSLKIFQELGDRRGIAFVLEGFACLAAAESQPLRAYYLAMAAATLRQIIGTAAPPAWEHSQHDKSGGWTAGR